MTDPDKYAIGEYERRFLVEDGPPAGRDPRSIVDRYIDGTRMRLRTITDSEGTLVARKLGHKRRIDGAADHVMHTSLLLDPQEFALLAALPGREVTKIRRAVDGDQWVIAVDAFAGPLEGLVLAEVDVGDPDALNRFEPPAWMGPEVTHDERFTGGGLAGRCWADVAPVVEDVRRTGSAPRG